MTEGLSVVSLDLQAGVSHFDAPTVEALLSEGLAEVESSDAHQRTVDAADGIAVVSPDVIVVQGAALWYTGEHGERADVEVLDSASLLLDELWRKGAGYRLAADCTVLEVEARIGDPDDGARTVRLVEGRVEE